MATASPRSVAEATLNRLKEHASKHGVELLSESFSSAMDAHDPLAKFRSEFNIPKAHADRPDSGEAVYLCGNSLGLLPKRTQKYVSEEMTKWASMGVEGHFRGDRPWARIDDFVTPLAAELVGAASSEDVAIMNSLSLNLHLFLVGFYRPTAQRFKILMESNAFCSDHHVVRSQLQLHGYNASNGLVLLYPRGEKPDTKDIDAGTVVQTANVTLNTQDIIDTIKTHGHEIAVVLLPGVQFYTGQAFDMAAITKAAHEAGCIVGFDLAHAVGNIPLRLHDWDVDFACWCSYKYLNSGPGSIAGAFLHPRWAKAPMSQLPRLAGWWGQELSTRFAMKAEWDMKPGAQSFQVSNPPVLPTVCVQASLEVFKEAGGTAAEGPLRHKSLLLTGWLEYLLLALIPAEHMTIITPQDPEARGCQLSLLLARPVKPVMQQLEQQGVICDAREPNVIRVAPTPLYNRFSDVWKFVHILKQVLQQ